MTKEMRKKLEGIAARLPLIYEKRKVKFRALGKDLPESIRENPEYKDKIDPETFYTYFEDRMLPVNHLKELINVYSQNGNKKGPAAIEKYDKDVRAQALLDKKNKAEHEKSQHQPMNLDTI